MAAKKLSEITPAVSLPALNDYVVGVNNGLNTDKLITLSQISSVIGGGGPTTFPPMVDTGIFYQPALTTGFSYTIPNNAWHVVFNGTMTLATGTVTMPAIPIDGQVIRLKTMQTIQGLTVLPNSGQTILGGDFPTTMPAFTYFEATYDLATTTWYIEFIAAALVNLNQALNLYVSILSGTISGGSGYTAGGDADSGYLAVALTGGHGAGATADIRIVAGAVHDVCPVSQGTGYQVGDVLSATAASIGGTGSGFTFTVTAIGNDLQSGTSSSTPFLTLSRAKLAVSQYNLAPGFTVTINAADGHYNEQIIATALVGSSGNQVNWRGNLTRRENVHVKPTAQNGTSFTQFAILSVFENNAYNVQGFWFDGRDPGFGDWQPIGAVQNSVISIDKCRLSLPDDGGWHLYENNRGSTINVNEITYDFGGNQSSYVDGTSDSILNVLGLQTLNPNVSNPLWGAFIATNTSLFVNPTAASAWSGWNPTQSAHGAGGPAGGAFNSSVTVQFADFAELPGNAYTSFTNAGNFAGAEEKTGVGPASYTGFSAPLGTILNLTAGSGGDLLFPNTWAVFNCGVGDGIHNHFQLFYSDSGTDTTVTAAPVGRHVVLTNLTSDYNYQTPLTGATITMDYRDNTLIIDPAGALAMLTVVLPFPAFDGQRVRVEAHESIGTLNVFGGAGDLTKNAPAFLNAGTGLWARYKSSNTTWYCSQ